jgi:hypothetical protein
LRATANAKINYDDVCLFEIIPQQHLRHYCEVKNDITNWVLENHQKPQNHQHMVDVMELCDDISQKIPAIDLNRLYRHSKHDRKARYPHSVRCMGICDGKINNETRVFSNPKFEERDRRLCCSNQ